MRIGNFNLPDFLTKQDLQEALRRDRYRPDWRFRDITVGPISLGPGETKELFGPDTGFVWELKRIAVVNSETPIELYKNVDAPGSYLITVERFFFFPYGTCVLYAGTKVMAKNPEPVESTEFNITVMVAEVPAGCEWSL